MKHIFSTAILMATMSSSAFAQGLTTEELIPNGFVGIQAGAHFTSTQYTTENYVAKPFVGIQVGSWFIPQMGARLSLQGYQNEFKIGEIVPKYSFKSLTTDIDLLFSLSNIFFPNRTSQRWNTMLVAGLGAGANTTWDKEYTGDKLNTKYIDLANDVDKFWLNSRVGLGVEYNINKTFGVNLEVDYNWKNRNIPFLADKKSLKDITAAIGLNVRFASGGKKTAPAPAATPVTSQADYEAEAAARAAAEAKAAEAARVKAAEARRIAEAEATARKAKAAEEAKWAGPLADVNLEYDLRGTDPKNPEAIQNVVEWVKRHADKKITVNGYADRGTGNPSINMRYSRMRATKVADALKNAGVPADQIVVKAWGDKVQPYKENDKNRCVIVVEK